MRRRVPPAIPSTSIDALESPNLVHPSYQSVADDYRLAGITASRLVTRWCANPQGVPRIGIRFFTQAS